MAIEFNAEQNAWILSTDRTAYVLGVNSDGGWLQHLYWDKRLPHSSDYFVANDRAMPSNYSFPSTVAEEFNNQGRLKFEEPCIRAVFPDGGRDTVLIYDSFRQNKVEGGDELIVTLRDSFYPLKVQLYYRTIDVLDLIVRRATVENSGGEPVRIEQLAAAVWHLPLRPEGETYRLSHLAGHWGREFQIQRQQLSVGKLVLDSRRGFTSPHSNPWFAFDGRFVGEYATEESGSVWYGALSWSGNWKLTAHTQISGRTSLIGGFNDFDFEWFLDGGESLASPTFVAGYTEGGFGAASRNLHRYTLNYVLPRSHAQAIRPVLYNAWEVHTFNVNEQNQIELAERAAALGVELFVVDDGWFGNGINARNDDNAGLGDWQVNREKFPRGLTPLIERVKQLGMRFGIWVEPEMVNPQSELYAAHPEWVYHFPHRERTQQRNQLMLNLARPDVVEYLFQALDKLLGENEITFVKWDFNRALTEPGWPDAPRARQREMWVRHVQNLYNLLQRLRERHPQVVWESCASGGGRADLGILQYTDQVWTSDNTDAFERLFIQYGYTQAYPVKTMLAWVTDSPNAITKRKLSVRYRCHSAMCGVMSLGGALTEWTEQELAETKQLIAEYKQIRHIIQDGDLYRLREPQSRLAALQYVSRDRTEAIVLVFLHSRQLLAALPRLYLRGLEDTALYQVEGLDAPMSGSALSTVGLKLSLTLDFDSVLIKLRRI